MIEKYIVEREIYYIFVETERMQGSSAPMQWWDHVGMDFKVSLSIINTREYLVQYMTVYLVLKNYLIGQSL